MDQKTLEKSPGFDRLQADITEMIAAIERFVKTRLEGAEGTDGNRRAAAARCCVDCPSGP
jgi:hypothetical protein